jgi:cellulase
MAYMAKVPSALQTSVTGLGWFKVYQDGYSGGTGGTWATSTLIKNKGKVSFTIPSCIPPGTDVLFVAVEGPSLSCALSTGNYFLRAEM